MEKTLGKRIMENRKRLKLTQDALAEQLGVTAQAVSKWENDQSCPDIAIFLKLADIFGITTDELLGKESPVHEAEVVQETPDKADKNKWEITYETGKKGSIIFALCVLLFGGLLLTSRILSWDASWWDILWPIALIMVGLEAAIPKFSFFGLGCTVFGTYFLISNLKIWQIPYAAELIFPAIVVIFGLSLLADAFRKPKKPKFKVIRNGKSFSAANDELYESSFNAEGSAFLCHVSFGSDNRKIELPILEHGDIQCEFGQLTVDLSECAQVSEECSIDAHCDFGRVTLLVPSRFRVVADSNTAFAKLHIYGQPNENNEGTIYLNTQIDFGNMIVRYI